MENNEGACNDDTVLVFDRDWDEIKEKYLSFIPEQQRDDLLEIIVRSLVYN